MLGRPPSQRRTDGQKKFGVYCNNCMVSITDPSDRLVFDRPQGLFRKNRNASAPELRLAYLRWPPGVCPTPCITESTQSTGVGSQAKMTMSLAALFLPPASPSARPPRKSLLRPPPCHTNCFSYMLWAASPITLL